jgi:Mrp family chromosome partitioning ATPase
VAVEAPNELAPVQPAEFKAASPVSPVALEPELAAQPVQAVKPAAAPKAPPQPPPIVVQPVAPPKPPPVMAQTVEPPPPSRLGGPLHFDFARPAEAAIPLDPAPAASPAATAAPVAPVEAPAAESPSAASPASPLESGMAFLDTVRGRLALPELGAQYRELSEGLLGPLPADQPAVLLLVGAEYDDAVAETLIHVAALLGAEGPGEVVLVDGNTTDRTLSRRLGLAGRHGLIEKLRHRAPTAELLVQTPLAGVCALPAGSGVSPHGPSVTDAWASLLGELRERFAWVLVDAGSVDGPLAEPLARTCDAAYLLVRLGETDSRTARMKARRLIDWDACLFGCVVTD